MSYQLQAISNGIIGTSSHFNGTYCDGTYYYMTSTTPSGNFLDAVSLSGTTITLLDRNQFSVADNMIGVTGDGAYIYTTGDANQIHSFTFDGNTLSSGNVMTELMSTRYMTCNNLRYHNGYIFGSTGVATEIFTHAASGFTKVVTEASSYRRTICPFTYSGTIYYAFGYSDTIYNAEHYVFIRSFNGATTSAVCNTLLNSSGSVSAGPCPCVEWNGTYLYSAVPNSYLNIIYLYAHSFNGSSLNKITEYIISDKLANNTTYISLYHDGTYLYLGRNDSGSSYFDILVYSFNGVTFTPISNISSAGSTNIIMNGRIMLATRSGPTSTSYAYFNKMALAGQIVATPTSGPAPLNVTFSIT